MSELVLVLDFGGQYKRLGDIPYLAQGTIYPDVVESGGKHGATIKSHHNVGGLPENLSFTEFEVTENKLISSRRTNEIASVSRVVYDSTSKPPATVEWE